MRLKEPDDTAARVMDDQSAPAGLDALVFGDHDRQTVGVHELEAGDVQIDLVDAAV